MSAISITPEYVRYGHEVNKDVNINGPHWITVIRSMNNQHPVYPGYNLVLFDTNKAYNPVSDTVVYHDPNNWVMRHHKDRVLGNKTARQVIEDRVYP